MATLTASQRDAALEAIARAIELHADEIEAANRLDVAAATGDQPSAIVDRLTLTPGSHRRSGRGRARGDRPCPTRSAPCSSRVERDNGLVIEKVRVPLGVVAIIYEARPNVTTDAAALTLKSGNACILRGSRMAAHSNRVLIDLVRAAIESSGLPVDAVQEMETDRDRLREFISQPGAADVVIPRGGEELKHFLLDNSRIPVLAAAGGNNHVYVDATADAAMAEAIAVNAKIDRPGRVQLGRDAAGAPRPARADGRDHRRASRARASRSVEGPEAWATEFLDMKMAVRTVDSLDDALDHIATYGTGHSEAIVTDDADGRRPVRDRGRRRRGVCERVHPLHRRRRVRDGCRDGDLHLAAARPRPRGAQRTDHDQIRRSGRRPGASLTGRNPRAGFAVSCICDAQ